MADDDRRAPMRDMFKTRSYAWREVGLARQLNKNFVRRARRELVGIGLALVGVLVLYDNRNQLFGRGSDTPVRILTVIALVILGWAFARDIGRSIGPQLFRRLDPGTAGIVGFVIRLVAVVVAVIVALRIAGLQARELVATTTFTAVVLGLAAQQTLGNLFAGTVLLSARPFRVGERVRMEAGAIGGAQEGVVSSLGLLYTSLASGENTILVPNSQVLAAAIIPLREPDSVDLLARLRPDVRPSELQRLLDELVTVPMRSAPDIMLEEVDADSVVVRIQAAPLAPKDGTQLADEILAAVATVATEGTRSNGDLDADASVSASPATDQPAAE
jgi:small-conductance mechanosensitive channel